MIFLNLLDFPNRFIFNMSRPRDMIFYKTMAEIEIMRHSNLLVGEAIAEVAKFLKPGVTTKQANDIAERFIRFFNDNNFKRGIQPGCIDRTKKACCTSSNNN